MRHGAVAKQKGATDCAVGTERKALGEDVKGLKDKCGLVGMQMQMQMQM